MMITAIPMNPEMPPRIKKKEGFRPAEKSYSLKGIIDFTFNLIPVTDFGIYHRFYERIHQ